MFPQVSGTLARCRRSATPRITGGASGGRRSRSRDRAASGHVVACADDVSGGGVGDGQRRPAGDPGGGRAPRPRAGRAWSCRTRPRSARRRRAGGHRAARRGRDRRRERRARRRRRRRRLHRDRRHPARRGASPTWSRASEAGANVVSTSFYPLLHPASAPRELLDVVERGLRARRHRRCSSRASTRAGRSTSCPRW